MFLSAITSLRLLRNDQEELLAAAGQVSHLSPQSCCSRSHLCRYCSCSVCARIFVLNLCSSLCRLLFLHFLFVLLSSLCLRSLSSLCVFTNLFADCSEASLSALETENFPDPQKQVGIFLLHIPCLLCSGWTVLFVCLLECKYFCSFMVVVYLWFLLFVY